MSRRAGFVFILLAGCSSTTAAPPPELLAGVGMVDLTPARPVPLGGYGARQGKPMEGVHDPVYAKALWLETPTARVCLVATDLVGTSLDMRDAVRPADAPLVLAASHTHSSLGALAPGFWQLAMGPFDAALRDETVAKIRQAVAAARASLRPARLAFARTDIPGLSRNRRSPSGPVDPELGLMVVLDVRSRPMALVATFAAHATILPDRARLLSADWPGAFQRALEARAGCPVLYLNGAEGDVAPRAPGGTGDFGRVEAMGAALAERAASLLPGIEKRAVRGTIRYVERGVDLPSPTLPSHPTRSVLALLELGGTRMFCVPGEPCAALGLELKKRFPGAWVVGLANDHLGYFLTEEDYRAGGYERMMSFYGPTMGPWLVDELSKLGGGDHAEDRSGQSEGGRREDDHRRQPQ
ncbi:MAG TPA: neutral/alkaline non-lysosomal ceramidase N-terminal domain-containing protein [Planctomycetota bacterium]